MSKNFYIILPSAKISGGNKEAIKLAEYYISKGNSVKFLLMWKSNIALNLSKYEVTFISNYKANFNLFTFLQIPIIFFKYLIFILPISNYKVVTTHFSTYYLTLFNKRNNIICFVQDLEWNFIYNKFLKFLIRKYILSYYKNITTISANNYIFNELKNYNLKPKYIFPIWADISFLSDSELERTIDFICVLRKGVAKRLDLYLKFIKLATINGKSVLVITMEPSLAELAASLGAKTLLNPSIEDMRMAYMKSKIFIMLSDSEGFGLPPLESMGSGCIPICRDCGGVRAFMLDELADNLIPLNYDIDYIYKFSSKFISSKKLIFYSKLAKKIFLSGLSDRKEIFII